MEKNPDSINEKKIAGASTTSPKEFSTYRVAMENFTTYDKIKDLRKNLIEFQNQLKENGNGKSIEQMISAELNAHNLKLQSQLKVYFDMRQASAMDYVRQKNLEQD